MNAKTETEIIKILTEHGGKLWEKENMRRVYFNGATILAAAGLEVTRYNTGNISGATLGGEEISNSEAKRIIGAYMLCKFYYDLGTAKFCIKGEDDLRRYNQFAHDFFAAITAKLAADCDRDEITSGLGIGGVGSDDYSIHTDAAGEQQYIPGSSPAGSQVLPAGTTYGHSSPGARCARCGKPADWNPGAGERLCPRHWDEY